MIGGWGIACEIALRLMSLNPYKSTLFQTMTWCHQGIRHWLCQFGPGSMSATDLGIVICTKSLNIVFFSWYTFCRPPSAPIGVVILQCICLYVCPLSAPLWATLYDVRIRSGHWFHLFTSQSEFRHESNQYFEKVCLILCIFYKLNLEWHIRTGYAYWYLNCS